MIFDNYCIERVEFVTYLGIIIDQHLNYYNHINVIRDKVAKGIGMLKMCHYFLPKFYVLSIYNAFVLPHLNYCVELWGNACMTYLQPLRVMQKKCIRLLCGVPATTHCKPLANELQLLLLDDIYVFSRGVLMFKCFHNDIVTSSLLTRTMHLFNTRYSDFNFYVHPVRTSIRKNFVLQCGVIWWNSLNLSLRTKCTLASFKLGLKSGLLNEYVL